MEDLSCLTFQKPKKTWHLEYSCRPISLWVQMHIIQDNFHEKLKKTTTTHYYITITITMYVCQIEFNLMLLQVHSEN